MPLPKFIQNIFAGSASELIKNVGEAADKLFTSKEEKAKFNQEMTNEINRHMERLTELAATETEAYLKDVQDARNSNARIQESEKASWLAKNVGYILDLSVATLFYAMLFMIFFIEIPEKNKEIFYTAFGVLGAKYGSSFDFHRGSSKGSEEKQKHIASMINNKN